MHHAGPAHLLADEVSHLPDQVGAPPGRQSGAGREHHVAAGQESAESLGVEEHRDAEPASAQHLALDGADQADQFCSVVLDELGDVPGRIAEHILDSVGVRTVRVDQRPGHARGQLVTFLGGGHLGQQQVGSLGGLKAGVVPGACGCGRDHG